MKFMFSKGSLFVLTSLCTYAYLKHLFWGPFFLNDRLIQLTLIQAFVSESLAQFQALGPHGTDLPIVISSSFLFGLHTIRCFWVSTSLRYSLGLAGFLFQSFQPTTMIHWLSQLIWLAFADDSLWTQT